MQYLCIKPPINPADQNKILIQDANKQQTAASEISIRLMQHSLKELQQKPNIITSGGCRAVVLHTALVLVPCTL